MRVISTGTNGAVDYLTGARLLASPSLLGISDGPAASGVLRTAGLAATAYSLLSDYEFGLVRAIPVPAHLPMDAASGALRGRPFRVRTGAAPEWPGHASRPSWSDPTTRPGTFAFPLAPTAPLRRAAAGRRVAPARAAKDGQG